MVVTIKNSPDPVQGTFRNKPVYFNKTAIDAALAVVAERRDALAVTLPEARALLAARDRERQAAVEAPISPPSATAFTSKPCSPR